MDGRPYFTHEGTGHPSRTETTLGSFLQRQQFTQTALNKQESKNGARDGGIERTWGFVIINLVLKRKQERKT